LADLLMAPLIRCTPGLAELLMAALIRCTPERQPC
jgi:hypothetical protein